MKRLTVFAAGLIMIGACERAPLAQGSAFTSSASAKPAADTSSVPAAASGVVVATSGKSAAAGVESASLREVTIPAGTVLPVDLETSVGSDISRVEQPVTGRLRHALTIGGAQVLPAGTLVTGHVTQAQRPGKVKGRGLIAMRFTRLDTPGSGATPISSATISRMAPATKQKDALQILGPAAAGAVIGRIAGGKSGAAKGAVIGGGAGTGYVLSTRGKEVRLGKGADLAVKLPAPVTIHIAGR